MEQEKYYFRVGILVAISLVASFFTITWFATSHRHINTLDYAIYFDSAVSGLKLGAPVKLKGLDVGMVTDIRFKDYEEDIIEVIAMIEDTAPIRQDTVATLQMKGITGTAYVALENTGDNPEALVLEEDADYLVIASRPSAIERVFSGVPELLDSLNNLSQQANKLLNDNSVDVVNTTVTDVRELIAEGKLALREIKMLAKSLREDPSQVLRGSKHKGVEIEP